MMRFSSSSIGRKVPRLRELLAQRDQLMAEVRQLRVTNRECVNRSDELQLTLDRSGFYPSGHFHSPIPGLDAVRGREDLAEPDTLPGLDLRDESQLALLDVLAPLCSEQPFHDEPDGRHRYYFRSDNIFFGEGDGLVYYALLRHLRPRRVIEVGIGFSSAVLLDTIDEYFSGECETTFIDPGPERMQGLLQADRDSNVRIISSPVQDVDHQIFEGLAEGDILFIDTSHVSKLGSDTNYLLLEILPTLPPGVVVHIHDIFWPFDYPLAWVREGRAWNETYLLRALLINNDRLKVLWFSDYLRSRYHDRVRDAIPVWAKNPGGSLWLQVQ